MVGAFFGRALVVADINQPTIGEPVERRMFAVVLQVVRAIGIENRPHAGIAGQEDRGHVFVAGDRIGAAALMIGGCAAGRNQECQSGKDGFCDADRSSSVVP